MVLLAMNWPALERGPYQPLLLCTTGPTEPSDNPDDVHLAKLEELLVPPNGSQLVDHDLIVCKMALDELRRVSALPYSPCKTLEMKACIYIWPGTVSQEFVELMYERKPEALIILAHYCVLLKKMNGCWYMEGLGENLLSAISEALSLDWRPWIEWAIEQPVASDSN